jgi:Subtilase family
MIIPTVPPGHVRALVERRRDKEGHLARAALAVLSGQDPSRHIEDYNRENSSPGLIIDPSFGAIAIGGGTRAGAVSNYEIFLQPEKSEKFLVTGFVEASGRERVPPFIDKEPVHSDPLIGGLLDPCRPTCGTSRPVGHTGTVRQKLSFPTLQYNGLDGSGVGVAIVDSGIYLPRIERLLGEAMNPIATPVNLDVANSWNPLGLVTKAGKHRLGHGTMCAYDALIVAPNATLLDVPMLLARPVADHRVTATVGAAMLAYLHLLKVWVLGLTPFNALVVSNSWGIFHPSMEDFPPTHPYRFIDNSNHIFHLFTQVLAFVGVDVIFCGNNCGNDENCAGDCASGTCLSRTDRMIMGANTYQDVLTVGGCDTNDRMVGYSSRGPSIPNMFLDKPDLVAYTHFLGSKTSRIWAPDTGVSAACPVAAGCIAALGTSANVRPNLVPPATLFQTLRTTARKPAGAPAPGWDPAFGYGVIDPVAAGRALGIIP